MIDLSFRMPGLSFAARLEDKALNRLFDLAMRHLDSPARWEFDKKGGPSEAAGMSWFLSLIGSPAAVKAKIQADACLSPALKAAFVEICDDKPWCSQDGYFIRISGSGHSGYGSSIASLVVERVQLAPEPAPAPVETPAESAAPAPATG